MRTFLLRSLANRTSLRSSSLLLLFAGAILGQVTQSAAVTGGLLIDHTSMEASGIQKGVTRFEGLDGDGSLWLPTSADADKEATQTTHEAHVAAVARAQKASYAITEATNGCPTSTTEILGWPAALIRQCIYSKGGLTAYVLLLDVKPEVIATWIETECARVLPGKSKCFQTVLTCGNLNSGMMFPIGGNILEDMENKPFVNFFFRNGMTVRMPGQRNGFHEQVPLDRQKELALMPSTDIISIPTGLTRFWRTLPRQFARRFPSESIPKNLVTAQKRQKWLDIARAEFLAALSSPNNRLLEAWIAAHPKTIGSGKFPDDEAP